MGKLLAKYPAEVADWRAFHDYTAKRGEYEDQDYRSMALGFFRAKGIPNGKLFDIYEELVDEGTHF